MIIGFLLAATLWFRLLRPLDLHGVAGDLPPGDKIHFEPEENLAGAVELLTAFKAANGLDDDMVGQKVKVEMQHPGGGMKWWSGKVLYKVGPHDIECTRDAWMVLFEDGNKEKVPPVPPKPMHVRASLQVEFDDLPSESWDFIDGDGSDDSDYLNAD